MSAPHIDEHGQVVVKEKKEEAMSVLNRRGQEFPSTFALEDEDAGWSDDSTGRSFVTGSTNNDIEGRRIHHCNYVFLQFIDRFWTGPTGESLFFPANYENVTNTVVYSHTIFPLSRLPLVCYKTHVTIC